MERLKRFIPINWEMASHPANWLILFLMVYIAGLAISMVFPAAMTAASNGEYDDE